MVIEKLMKGLLNSEKAKANDYIESFSKKIIMVDEYHEKAYRCMMTVYAEKGLYNEAIKIYSQLAKKLKVDLGVAPEQETTTLYEKILKGRNSSKNMLSRGDNYAWKEEAFLILSEYQKFLSSQQYCHCIIKSDICIDKTSLIKRFLESQTSTKHIVIEFSLLQKHISYFAVESVINSLEDYFGQKINTCCDKSDLQYIHQINKSILKLTKSGEKFIIYLKNMCCIDSKSLPIIITTLLSNKSNVFVLGEYCQNFQREEELINKLNLLSNFKIINLVVNNGKILTNPLKTTTKNKIKELIADLDKDELTYLELLSIFENGIEIDILSQMVNTDLITALKVIGCLKNRKIINETKTINHVLLKISLKPIIDFFNEKNGHLKQDTYHKIAAQIYEKKYLQNTKDYFYISEMVYHFNFTDLEYEKLYYSLIHLEYILNYYDEFFPSLKNFDSFFPFHFYLNRDSLYEEFDKLRDMINKLEDSLSIDKLNELQMLFDFLLGRTLNRDGKREKGILYIKELIAYAQKLGRDDFLLKGYLETIYYGIKCSDTKIMGEYIHKAYLINRDNFEVENGILYRLHGLYYIMIQDYDEAEGMLRRSIDIFENPKLKATNYINVSAAYDYLGLLFRNKGQYVEAEKYLKRAIDICLEKGNKKSLDIFYADLGYTYFLKGEFNQSLIYCEKSMGIYNLFGTYWLRSIIESCLSMIYLYNDKPEKAIEHFRRAEIFSRKEYTPEEMSVLEKAKAELRKRQIISG